MEKIFAFIGLVIANLGYTFHLSTRMGKKANREDTEELKLGVQNRVDWNSCKEVHAEQTKTNTAILVKLGSIETKLNVMNGAKK